MAEKLIGVPLPAEQADGIALRAKANGRAVGRQLAFEWQAVRYPSRQIAGTEPKRPKRPAKAKNGRIAKP